MKWIVGLAAAGVAIAATMPGRSAESLSPPQLEARMAYVAKGMQPLLPKRVEGGMLLTGVTARGRTLVMRFTEAPDWRDEMTDDEAVKLISGVICRQSGIGGAVRQGGTIRFAFTAPTGESLPTIDVDRCRS